MKELSDNQAAREFDYLGSSQDSQDSLPTEQLSLADLLSFQQLRFIKQVVFMDCF